MGKFAKVRLTDPKTRESYTIRELAKKTNKTVEYLEKQYCEYLAGKISIEKLFTKLWKESKGIQRKDKKFFLLPNGEKLDALQLSERLNTTPSVVDRKKR